MYFLALGLALLIMKYLEVGPVAGWSWWIVLSPFAMAVVWWWFADKSGYTRRRVDQREEQRKADRINAGRKRMGLPPVKDTKR